jgi:predicted transcriptional regulator
MARAETIVQLTSELVELLDAEAARRKTSRSALIREAITSHLAEAAAGAVTRSIVEGYRRVPQSRPDEWGDIGALSDRSTRETLQRLDSEERNDGSKSW